MTSLANTPTAELQAMAQGCTELTCIYHGEVNAELRRRMTPHSQP